MFATTLPPLTVLPRCSVASATPQSVSTSIRRVGAALTGYALHSTQLQCLLGLLSRGPDLLPDVVEVAGERRDHVVAAAQIELGHLVLVVVAALLRHVGVRVNLLDRKLEHVREGVDGQRA